MAVAQLIPTRKPKKSSAAASEAVSFLTSPQLPAPPSSRRKMYADPAYPLVARPLT